MIADLLRLTAIIVIQLMSLIMKITSPRAQCRIAPPYGQCEQSLAAASLRVTETFQSCLGIRRGDGQERGGVLRIMCLKDSLPHLLLSAKISILQGTNTHTHTSCLPTQGLVMDILNQTQVLFSTQNSHRGHHIEVVDRDLL